VVASLDDEPCAHACRYTGFTSFHPSLSALFRALGVAAVEGYGCLQHPSLCLVASPHKETGARVPFSIVELDEKDDPKKTKLFCILFLLEIADIFVLRFT